MCLQSCLMKLWCRKFKPDWLRKILSLQSCWDLTSLYFVSALYEDPNESDSKYAFLNIYNIFSKKKYINI